MGRRLLFPLSFSLEMTFSIYYTCLCTVIYFEVFHNKFQK